MTTLVTEILDLIGKVPGTFWGVIVGSLFSLGGVRLTNRHSDRRLATQFANDRELRVAERDFVLRRDTYMAAAEAIQTGFITIANFSNLETPISTITASFTERLVAIARVQIVAKPDTLRSVMDIAGEFASAILSLSSVRIPLEGRKRHLGMLDDQIAAFAKERDRYLELMKEYNLSGVRDDQKWTTLQTGFKFEEKRVLEAIEERKVKFAELFSAQMKFSEECVSTTMSLRRQAVSSIVLIREELGLPIDGHDLEEMFAQQIERQKVQFAEFFKRAPTFVS